MPNVDTLVDTIYQEAGENPARPQGVGPLLTDFFRPVCHTVWNCHRETVAGLPGWTEKQAGGDWVVHLPGSPTHGAALGYALARVLAHEAVSRWSFVSWSDKQERILADAIILPTPALVLLVDHSVDEIAAFLVTSVALVERRCRLLPRSSSRLRVAPLAKGAPLAEVIDLEGRRQNRRGARA